MLTNSDVFILKKTYLIVAEMALFLTRIEIALYNTTTVECNSVPGSVGTRIEIAFVDEALNKRKMSQFIRLVVGADTNRNVSKCFCMRRRPTEECQGLLSYMGHHTHRCSGYKYYLQY